MIDRLTERARKSLAYARIFATKSEVRYLGTEHLLIGLLQDSHSVASHALKKCGIKEKDVLLEIKKLTKSLGEPSELGASLPLTPRLNKVILNAKEESEQLGHTYTGSEHLLLGLLKVADSVAVQVLKELELDFDSLQSTLLELLGADCAPETSNKSNSVWLETLTRFQKEEADLDIITAAGGVMYPRCGILKEFDEQSLVLEYTLPSSAPNTHSQIQNILIDRSSIMSIAQKPLPLKVEKDES